MNRAGLGRGTGTDDGEGRIHECDHAVTKVGGDPEAEQWNDTDDESDDRSHASDDEYGDHDQRSDDEERSLVDEGISI